VETVVLKKAAPAVAKVLTAGQKAAKYLSSPVGSLAKGGAAVAGGTAALVLATGLASYYGTTWLLNRWKAKKVARQQKLNDIADAYRLARQNAAAQLGRPLTPSELRAMALEYKRAVASLGV
jgi:hypothetical protein